MVQKISTYKTMTLKMRSRSPKSNKLLSLSHLCTYASLKKIHPLVQKKFHLQDYGLANEVKVIKNLISSLDCHSDVTYASLNKIHPLVQKIFHLQDYDFENKVKVIKI